MKINKSKYCFKFFSVAVGLIIAVTYASAQTVVDETVAIVGRNMIKLSEIETTYLQSRGSSQNGYSSRCEVLENMLLNKLILDQAEIDSVEVSDQDVESELNSRINYMIQVYGSQERMERQMNKSLQEIKSSFRDLIRENILIQQKQSLLFGDVKITPQEVADYFNKIPVDSLPEIGEEYVLTQIVKLPVVSQEEKLAVKEKLNSYRDRILKGAKFSTLATLYSDDQVSAKNGGELGFFSRGEMVSEFENMAFSLQPGEISPVFETKYGYHIIQMIERRGDRVNCRHILLQPKVSSLQLVKARQELDSIKTLITDGKISFEDAIIKFSDDNSKINGGLIINPLNASAVFSSDAINETIRNIDKVDFASMKEGDITNPVEYSSESSNAYRLIQIKKKTAEHKVNLTDDFDKIQTLALNEKKMDIMHKWAEKKIPKTFIRIIGNWKDCGFQLNWVND